MKERPILFSGPMVQAIRAGLKNQTRRTAGLDHVNQSPNEWRLLGQGALLGRWAATFERSDTGDRYTAFCPYGQPGDRLWGRETFARLWFTPGDGWQTVYRADDNLDMVRDAAVGQWKPSIHMPRALSRLLFDLQDVRIERVQDISEADAIAEGMQAPGLPAATTNRAAFARLWDKINGKRGMGWSHNPWTWPLTIQQVTE